MKALPSLKSVIIINDFAHVNGGASQVALCSARALAELGINVVLFTAVEPIDSSVLCKNLEVISTGQYEILEDPNRLRAIVQGLWNYKARKKFELLLSTLDNSHTIIHLHSWTKALSSSITRSAIHKGFKVVCTLHDYFTACPNGAFFDYNSREICCRKPLSRSCVLCNCDVRSYSQKLWRIARQVIQSNLGLIPSGIRHFITISSLSEDVLKPFLPNNSALFRVRNPIDISRYENVNASLNSIYIYVGRLSPEKGVIFFAEVAAKMGIAPVFIGAGPCEAEIKKICPQAVISGWQSKEKVVEMLQNARILVLPSLWYETQGLVVAEAAARGIPAVVPDRCAARDMVIEGVTGLYFRSGDSESLAVALTKCSADGLVSNMSFAAFENYWADPSTITSHVEQLLCCYDTILNENGLSL